MPPPTQTSFFKADSLRLAPHLTPTVSTTVGCGGLLPRGKAAMPRDAGESVPRLYGSATASQITATRMCMTDRTTEPWPEGPQDVPRDRSYSRAPGTLSDTRRCRTAGRSSSACTSTGGNARYTPRPLRTKLSDQDGIGVEHDPSGTAPPKFPPSSSRPPRGPGLSRKYLV